VDCEADGGYGLCCFNGCFNRCLKDQQCQNVTKNVCFEKPSEVCEGEICWSSLLLIVDVFFVFEEVSKYGCNPMVMTMTVPVKIESCSYSEKVCATKLSEVCQDFPTEKCEVVTFEACSSHLVPFNETTLELVCNQSNFGFQQDLFPHFYYPRCVTIKLFPNAMLLLRRFALVQKSILMWDMSVKKSPRSLASQA